MRWRSNQYKTQKQHKSDHSTAEKDQDVLTGNIGYDLEHVKRKIGHNGDVHFRELEITQLHVKAALIFVEGLSDQELINKGLSENASFSHEAPA